MSNVDAVFACLQDDHKYEYISKHQFDARVKCRQQQNKIVERYIVSTYSDPRTQRALLNGLRSKKTQNEASNLPRPSCATIAEITYRISGEYPIWKDCLAYENTTDKFQHFKRCTISYHKKYSRLTTDSQAQASLAKYDCQYILRQHQNAMKLIYPLAFDKTGKGFYGPKDFSKPSCQQIDAWIAELEIVKKQEQQSSLAQQQQAFEERKARIQARKEKRQQAKADAVARHKRQQQVEAALEKSYENIYPEITKKQMQRLRNEQHPKDKINEQHIKNGLILAIHDYVPEETKTNFGIQGTLKHTIGGFIAYSNLPNSYIIYHAVKSIDNMRCEPIKANTTTCRYRFSTATSVDKKGADFSPAMQQLFQLVGAGRPVIRNYESVFEHNGTEWQPILSNEQKEGLLPPPPAKGQEGGFYSDDERAILCTIGDWLAC